MPPPVYVLKAEPEEICVSGPPPPARLEVPPPPPDVSAIWQPGYWYWDGADYRWADGCWSEPRPGYLYVDASYVIVDGTWRYRPPFWRPASHEGSGTDVVVVSPSAQEEPTRHRAPPTADGPTRHRAPPTADGPTPELPAPPEDPPEVVRLADPVDEPEIHPVEADPEAVRASEDDIDPDALRRHPEFRGFAEGRPAFGDDPDRPHGFPTDRTGAVVLSAEPRPPRQWRGPVLRPRELERVEPGTVEPDRPPTGEPHPFSERHPPVFTNPDPPEIRQVQPWPRHEVDADRWPAPVERRPFVPPPEVRSPRVIDAPFRPPREALSPRVIDAPRMAPSLPAAAYARMPHASAPVAHRPAPPTVSRPASRAPQPVAGGAAVAVRRR